MVSETSKETEIKLTDLFRASLEELKEDYKNFLKIHNLTYWDKNYPYYEELSKKHRLFNGNYDTYKKGIESNGPEVSVNVLLSLVNVKTYLLAK